MSAYGLHTGDAEAEVMGAGILVTLTEGQSLLTPRQARKDASLLLALAEIAERHHTGGLAGIVPLHIEGARLIEELGLTTRAYNCLKRAGFRTAEQVDAVKDSDLLALPNLGLVALREIRTAVSARL